MARRRNKVRDYTVYIALRLLAMFVHMLPARGAYAVARCLGGLLFRFDRKHRRRAVEHLKISFPEWDRARCRHVAKQSMQSLVCLGLELLLTPRLITLTTWRRHMRMRDPAENVRLLVERTSGLIYVVGHFGNWEVLGYAMAMLGFPNVAVARRLDNPYVHEYILGVREKTGQLIVGKKGATEMVGEYLAGGGAVCFIADQDAGRKGLFVDFFGRPASTHKSIALLAIEYRCPVIVVYGRRLDDTFRFELGVQRIIRPHEWADKADPVRWITQTYTSALEAVVRVHPDQYLWAHRRWKHRPKGQLRPPDGIA